MENEGRLFAKKSQSEEKSPSQIDYIKANALLKALKQLLDERMSHIKKYYPSLPGVMLIAFEQLFKLSSAMNLKGDLSPVNRYNFSSNIKRIVNSFDINQLTIQEDLSFYEEVITKLHNIMQSISNEKIVFSKEEKPTWQDLAKEFHDALVTLHGFVKRGITSDDIDTVLATCESYIVFIENQAMSPEILHNARKYLLVIKNLISKLRPKDEVGNYFRLSGLARSEDVANDNSDDNDGSLLNFLEMIKEKAAKDTTEIPGLVNSDSDEEEFPEGDKDSLKNKNPEQHIEKNKVEMDFEGANKILEILKNKISPRMNDLLEIIENLEKFTDVANCTRKKIKKLAYRQLKDLLIVINEFFPLNLKNAEAFHEATNILGDKIVVQLAHEDAEFQTECMVELLKAVAKTSAHKNSTTKSKQTQLNFTPTPEKLTELTSALYLAITQLSTVDDPKLADDYKKALQRCEVYINAIEDNDLQQLDRVPNEENGSEFLFKNCPKILQLILAVVPQPSKVDPRERILERNSYHSRRQLTKSTYAALINKQSPAETEEKGEKRYYAEVVTATIAEKATPTIFSPKVTNLLQRDLSKILEDYRAAKKENEQPKEIVEGDDVEFNEAENETKPISFNNE